MTKREYKKRCGQLRGVIRGQLYGEGALFARAQINGMTYIYNKISRNIIYKQRSCNGIVGIQYRATSIYRPVLERIGQDSVDAKYRVTASPHMRRHVRDVRRKLNLS